jgi:hypothetical protein
MSVGLPVTKDEIDMRAGDIARTFQRVFDDVLVMQGYLNATVDSDLTALGYSDPEIATLKASYAELSQLARIWVGAEALPTAKDFRTFVRQLWGVGAF